MASLALLAGRPEPDGTTADLTIHARGVTNARELAELALV